MVGVLSDIFDAIHPPLGDDPSKQLFAVMPVPGQNSYLIGKDNGGLACLLVSTNEQAKGIYSPIRLENFGVQFEVPCHVKKEHQPEIEGTFNVIQCRSTDRETKRYFLVVCETFLSILGDAPTSREIQVLVNRLAALFQSLQRPSVRPVNGLFGELYIISRSRSPVRALRAWRVDDNAVFDFSDGDIRLEVKAAAGKVRIHTFSYEQCNPPPGTIGIVASLCVTQAAGGVGLETIIQDIGSRVSAHPDLMFKLHEVIASTLGNSLKEALAVRFDVKVANSSLRFFALQEVPAIRGSLPIGVSDVHFRSDLSAVPTLAIQTLIGRDPVFSELLPTDL